MRKFDSPRNGRFHSERDSPFHPQAETQRQPIRPTAALAGSSCRPRANPASFLIYIGLLCPASGYTPSSGSHRVAGRTADVGGDLEANPVYAPHRLYSRYKLHEADGTDIGEAHYAVLIKPGETISRATGGGQRPARARPRRR